MSGNPATGLAYANTLEMSFPYQIVKPEYKKGERYLGMNLRGVNFPAKGTGRLQATTPPRSSRTNRGRGRSWRTAAAAHRPGRGRLSRWCRPARPGG